MFRNIIAKTVENGFNVRDEYRHKSLPELKQIAEHDTFPFRVCALNVEGDLNVGVAIRTASLLGCEKFYIYGRRKLDRRSLVGAQNYLPIVRISGLTADNTLDEAGFWDFIEKENLYPVFVEQNGIPLDHVDWSDVLYSPDHCGYPKKNLCLVVGNESTGIPKPLLERGYPIVSIPQRGVLRSYNVSSAASIVMYDFVRKRGYLLGVDKPEEAK